MHMSTQISNIFITLLPNLGTHLKKFQISLPYSRFFGEIFFRLVDDRNVEPLRQLIDKIRELDSTVSLLPSKGERRKEKETRIREERERESAG